MTLPMNDNDPLAPVVAQLEDLAAFFEKVEGLARIVEVHGRATMAAYEAAVTRDCTQNGSQSEQG